MQIYNFRTEQDISRIKDLILNQNWENAIKQGYKIFNKFKNDTPPEIFALLSLACRRQGTKDIAWKIIRQGLNKFPDHPLLVMEQNEISVSEENWKDTQEYLSLLTKTVVSKETTLSRARLSISTGQSENYLKLKINTRTLENEDLEALEAYLRSTENIQDHEDIQTTQACKLLLQGRFRQAEDIFYSLTDSLDIPCQAKKLWNDAFWQLLRLVAQMGYGQNHDTHCQASLDAEKYNFAQEKIIVSGMGWSGSGAITDYLREFQEVDFAPIRELCHLDGPYSLASLQKFQGGISEYINFMLNFFSFTLFGFGVSARSSAMYDLERSKIKTRKLLHLIPYVHGVVNFLKHACTMYNDQKGLDKEKFIKAANILFDHLSYSLSKNKSNFILLDNYIHIQQIKMLDILDMTNIICVYRDPRSNYVALIEEDWKRSRTIHDKGPLAYCKYYRNIRKKADLYLKSLNKQNHKIQNIQFENFVSSRETRRLLAVNLGIDPLKRDRYRHFKPWNSMKNIYNYAGYRLQDEIKTIEKELPEHLYEQPA